MQLHLKSRLFFDGEGIIEKFTRFSFYKGVSEIFRKFSGKRQMTSSFSNYKKGRGGMCGSGCVCFLYMYERDNNAQFCSVFYSTNKI